MTKRSNSNWVAGEKKTGKDNAVKIPKPRQSPEDGGSKQPAPKK